MTDLLAVAQGRWRLVTTAVLLLTAAGLLSWATMPREEDPQFPNRNGLIVAAFPGADAETMERLVAEPIEDHLAEVETVWHVNTTVRAGRVIVHVELEDDVYDTAAAWEEVEEALEKAHAEFPNGVSAPRLDDDLVSQEAVVLAVSGSFDTLGLSRAAHPPLMNQFRAFP